MQEEGTRILGKKNMDYKFPSRLRYDQYARGGKGGQYGRNRSPLQSWTGFNFRSTGAGKPEGFLRCLECRCKECK